MYSLISELTDEDFYNIVKRSFTYKQVAREIGYCSFSGTLADIIKERIDKLHIDISHFKKPKSQALKESDIFVENSKVSQRSLRKWYRKRNEPEYKCSICGQDPFWNDKELTLILDHINGYNTDNRLENLRWVCPNCNQQLDTTNGKNINHNKGIHKKHFCVDCGKEISRKAIRCKECSIKANAEKYKLIFKPNIERKVLKELIRSMPFTQIGKMYNVCDNTIRKWCDFYGLPKRTIDIKRISNEEWSKV